MTAKTYQAPDYDDDPPVSSTTPEPKILLHSPPVHTPQPVWTPSGMLDSSTVDYVTDRILKRKYQILRYLEARGQLQEVAEACGVFESLGAAPVSKLASLVSLTRLLDGMDGWQLTWSYRACFAISPFERKGGLICQNMHSTAYHDQVCDLIRNSVDG